MKDLTIENLIDYFNKNYHETPFSIESTIRDKSIDGDDAVDLLLGLGDEFNVTFENFEFERYFHSEIELSRYLGWFGLKKMRGVDENMTIKQLFDYMVLNKKG